MHNVCTYFGRMYVHIRTWKTVKAHTLTDQPAKSSVWSSSPFILFTFLSPSLFIYLLTVGQQASEAVEWVDECKSMSQSVRACFFQNIGFHFGGPRAYTYLDLCFLSYFYPYTIVQERTMLCIVFRRWNGMTAENKA